MGEKKLEKKKLGVKKCGWKKEIQKKVGLKKSGCQIGKNGGRLKYFLQKMLQKKEGLLIGKNLESQIDKNSGSGGKKKYG